MFECFLFEWKFQSGPYTYDITPDGRQFVTIHGDQEPLAELNVILGWSYELERLVPSN